MCEFKGLYEADSWRMEGKDEEKQAESKVEDESKAMESKDDGGLFLLLIWQRQEVVVTLTSFSPVTLRGGQGGRRSRR